MLLSVSNEKGQSANFAITRFSEADLATLAFSEDVEILNDPNVLRMAVAVAELRLGPVKFDSSKPNNGIGKVYYHEYLNKFAIEFHFVPDSDPSNKSSFYPKEYDETTVKWAKAYLIKEHAEVPHVWFS